MIPDDFHPIKFRAVPLRYRAVDDATNGHGCLPYGPEYMSLDNFEAVTCIHESGWKAVLMCMVKDVPPRFRHPLAAYQQDAKTGLYF